MKLRKILGVELILLFYFILISSFSYNVKALKINKSNNTFSNKLSFGKEASIHLFETLRDSTIKEKEAKIGNLIIDFKSSNNKYIVSGEDIKNNTEIVSIPFRNLIHILKPEVREFCISLGLSEFSESKLFSNQFFCLVFYLMNQMKKASSQYFKLYIDSLPKAFNEYFYFWTAEELKLIKNTFLENTYKIRMDNIDKYFELFKKTNFFQSRNKKSNFTLDDVKKAYLLVGSRNFGVFIGNKNQKKFYQVLIPFVDLFNYSPSYNTVWTNNLPDENALFKIKTKQEIMKREEIFVNYGKEDNSLLLANYGFTLEKNKFPIRTNSFTINFRGKIFNGLNMNEKDSREINLVREIICSDMIKDYKINLEKEELIKLHIEVFEAIKQELKFGLKNNQDRIKDVKGKLELNENERRFNLINIYRVVRDERVLIKNNIKFSDAFIYILSFGKKAYGEKRASDVAKQNSVYFERLLN